MRVSRNEVAIKAKVRPHTVGALYKGTTKRIEFDTIKKILHTLNTLLVEYKLGKVYTIEDIFVYRRID
ncbi:XRE family transcriptional regulator [Brevibacillus brevis X23]|nr:XRE family transcriptional regulator [Brevibacillus brevis X23]